MATDRELIRMVMCGAMDACEAMARPEPDLHAGEYEARSDDQDDASVGDLVTRFRQYPEGAARDVLRVRAAPGCGRKHPPEIAGGQVAAAMACSGRLFVVETNTAV